MNTMTKPATFLTAALCLAGTATTAHAADGEGWDWMVAPYGWAATIGTDLNTTRPPWADPSTDTSFSDIVDKLDGAFQIHVEGQGDRFGVFADFTYLGLADEKDRPRFRTRSDIDTRLFELAAVWSPGEERYRGWDVFAGLRYIDVDLTVEIEPVDPLLGPVTIDTGQAYSDFMLGARYTWDLSEHWGLTLRGDGSAGETEGTWNASAVAQYRMKRGAWLFGYRYLLVKVGTDENKTDITMGGPMIGYAMKF